MQFFPRSLDVGSVVSARAERRALFYPTRRMNIKDGETTATENTATETKPVSKRKNHAPPADLASRIPRPRDGSLEPAQSLPPGGPRVSLPAFRATEPQHRAILAYYERVAPLIVANFPNIPLTTSYYPDGLGTKPTYSGGTWAKPLPATIPRTTVTTPSGLHTYPTCAESTILWFAHRGGVGLHSWTPSPHDAERVGVARILVRPVGGAGQPLLKEALLALRAVLNERGLDAIPMFEAEEAALFIPLAGAPAYDAVRTWLHGAVDSAIARHPTMLVHESRPHELHNVPRIECTVSSNAVGRFSRLPYALVGDPDLPMATPFAWNELETLEGRQITAANAAARLAGGDLYAKLATELAQQRMPS